MKFLTLKNLIDGNTLIRFRMGLSSAKDNLWAELFPFYESIAKRHYKKDDSLSANEFFHLTLLFLKYPQQAQKDAFKTIISEMGIAPFLAAPLLNIRDSLTSHWLGQLIANPSLLNIVRQLLNVNISVKSDWPLFNLTAESHFANLNQLLNLLAKTKTLTKPNVKRILSLENIDALTQCCNFYEILTPHLENSTWQKIIDHPYPDLVCHALTALLANEKRLFALVNIEAILACQNPEILQAMQFIAIPHNNPVLFDALMQQPKPIEIARAINFLSSNDKFSFENQAAIIKSPVPLQLANAFVIPISAKHRGTIENCLNPEEVAKALNHLTEAAIDLDDKYLPQLIAHKTPFIMAKEMVSLSWKNLLKNNLETLLEQEDPASFATSLQQKRGTTLVAPTNVFPPKPSVPPQASEKPTPKLHAAPGLRCWCQ